MEEPATICWLIIHVHVQMALQANIVKRVMYSTFLVSTMMMSNYLTKQINFIQKVILDNWTFRAF